MRNHRVLLYNTCFIFRVNGLKFLSIVYLMTMLVLSIIFPLLYLLRGGSGQVSALHLWVRPKCPFEDFCTCTWYFSHYRSISDLINSLLDIFNSKIKTNFLYHFQSKGYLLKYMS